MAKKLTITTIVKKQDKCVVYHDDGVYCQWTETQKFNYDLIAETKNNANGIVLLITETEAQAHYNSTYYRMENHEAWTMAKWLIWMVYGKMETTTDKEAETVKFLRSCII